jgi:hypothetical protein
VPQRRAYTFRHRWGSHAVLGRVYRRILPESDDRLGDLVEPAVRKAPLLRVMSGEIIEHGPGLSRDLSMDAGRLRWLAHAVQSIPPDRGSTHLPRP